MSEKDTKLVRFRLPRNKKPRLATKAEIDALSEEELRRAAASDPDAPLLTPEELREFYPATPAPLRRRLGMTQAEFAACFELPVGTVRDWEQGRYQPDAAARALLRLIAAIPGQALRAFGRETEAARVMAAPKRKAREDAGV